MDGADRSLSDRIYEAAFVPDLWPAVLQDVAAECGSATGSLLVLTSMTHPPRYRTTPRTEAALQSHVSGGDWRGSEAAKSVLGAPPERLFYEFVPSREVVPPERFEADTVRRNLTKLGLAEQVGTCIPTITGELAIVTVERENDGSRHSAEEMARLNALRPHLARAGMIAGRMALERAQSMVAAMEVLGLPAIVLSLAGKVLAANPMAGSRNDLFQPRAHGGLGLPTRRADALFADSLSKEGGRRGVQSIPVEPEGDRPAAIIHVLPVRGCARDIFSGGEVLVIANELRPGAGPPIRLLTALYDLTPAEARIAAALTRGATLQVAAQAQGIGISTARTHLAQIFSKTGTHRQSQLVALLSVVGAPARGGA